jgi:ATP-dependent Clp protease ATP-binding subunit ClpA
MFERFSHAAREAVVQAQTEARDLQDARIGTEHLLLALLAEPGPISEMLHADGVDHASVRAALARHVAQGDTAEPLADTDAADAAALRAIGIDIDAVRRAIEENFGPDALQLPPAEPRKRGFLRRNGPPTGSPRGHIPFSDRAKKTLALSLREAVRLRHNAILPEHLLLGIVRDGNGLGARVLVDAGVDLEDLRTRAVAALRDQAA